MPANERDDLPELLRSLRHYLPVLKQQLMVYPPNADDEVFRFLVNKMAQFRDILITLETRLEEE